MFQIANRIRRVFSAFLVAGSVTISPATHAGIPVIDAAAIVVQQNQLIQAIQQVAAWAQQYEQMLQQIQQMKLQYDSLTGSRGLGDILNNQALLGVVPANLASTYSAINSVGYSGLTSAGKSLRDASKIYNCEDRSGDAQVACQSILNSNSQMQANLNNALDLVQQRTGQIQSLQGQINGTSDPKAIAELQARIQSENTQVANDANRIALMKATAEAQQQAADQAHKERWLKNLSQGNNSAIRSMTYQVP